MSITLTKDGTPLALPEDLIWSDEFTRSDVAQTTQRGIDGHLVVDSMEVFGGPITLVGDGDSAWITLGEIKTLKAWAAVPGQQFELDVRGDIRTVIFDHGEAEETRALAMTAVVEYSDNEDGDFFCSLTLRFIEV